MGRISKAHEIFCASVNKLMEEHAGSGIIPDVSVSVGAGKASISITYKSYRGNKAWKKKKKMVGENDLKDSCFVPARRNKAADLANAIEKCGGVGVATSMCVADAIGKSDDTVRRWAKLYGHTIYNNLFVEGGKA